MLWAGYFLTQWWQMLTSKSRSLRCESIEVVLKQQKVTTQEKPAALSSHGMKCSQVLLVYSKKHIHVYCQN